MRKKKTRDGWWWDSGNYGERGREIVVNCKNLWKFHHSFYSTIINYLTFNTIKLIVKSWESAWDKYLEPPPLPLSLLPLTIISIVCYRWCRRRQEQRSLRRSGLQSIQQFGLFHLHLHLHHFRQVQRERKLVALGPLDLALFRDWNNERINREPNAAAF